MNPIIETGGAHYYTQTGFPRYGATLREARKHNYLPSITTVLKAWPPGHLVDWVKYELLKARHNNHPTGEAAAPVIEGEDLTKAQQVYFKEILKKSNVVRDTAGDRGNEIHAGGEAILLRKDWNRKDPALKELARWLEEFQDGEPYWTERSLVNLDLRIAGRADALIRTTGDERPLLIDFKGRGFDYGPRKGWKAKRYSKDLVQLAFYASTMMDPPRVANLYVHREGECPIEVVEYTDKEREAAFKMVQNVVGIWYYENRYDPEINHDEILQHIKEAQNNHDEILQHIREAQK